MHSTLVTFRPGMGRSAACPRAGQAGSARLASAFGVVMASTLATLVRAEPSSEGERPARPAEHVYATFCASCHGADMRGGLGPGFVNHAWRYGDDDESIASTIREGRVEAGMPPMGGALSDDEIRELVAHLRRRIAHDAQEPVQVALRQEPAAAVVTELHAFRVETVSEELDTPWAVAFLADGRMLVTEKEGRLRVFEDGRLLPEPVRNTPEVWHIGQGGLLDVAVHPNHAENGWIYLSYSSLSAPGEGMTAVERGRLRAGTWVDRETVFRAPAGEARPGGAQFGSRLLLDESGHVFFSIGDRDFPDDAQDLRRPNGKIHRVGDDGGVPADNPFIGHDDALPTIWSFGHRNPQGLARDPWSGELWATEHGPRGGDELNRIVPGANYGWPRATYGVNYDGSAVSPFTSLEGMQDPVTHWTPSIGVCALKFYTGHRFPGWRNHLFMASLVQEELRRLEVREGMVMREETVLRGWGRVRDIATGPDGCLYVALNLPDRIIRLVPAEDPVPDDIFVHASPEEEGPPET
mgnify:CR=1 FL=1